MRMPLLICCALLALALAVVPATADEDGPEAKLIASKAASVVNVQFVLEITASRGGRVQEFERRVRASGVVVDPGGLVMLPVQAFEANLVRGRRGRRAGGRAGETPEMTANPTNIRVSFPGDEKEYAAILGAKDSKSGLAFVLIDDLGSKKPAALETARTAEPRVGQQLFGISRLGQGYDHAPVCTRTRVTGKVTKPRVMWAIEDGSRYVGKPLFTADGAVVGVCAMQLGGGESQGRMFLLPIASVQRVVARALTSAVQALDEIREARAEEAAGEAPADKGGAPGKDDKPKEGDDEKEGDGSGGKI